MYLEATYTYIQHRLLPLLEAPCQGVESIKWHNDDDENAVACSCQLLFSYFPPSPMSLQDIAIDKKALQKQGGDNLQSTTRQKYDVKILKEIVVFEAVIKEIVQMKGKLPDQLWEVAHTISKTLLGISVIMIRFSSPADLSILFSSVVKALQEEFRGNLSRCFRFGYLPLEIIQSEVPFTGLATSQASKPLQ